MLGQAVRDERKRQRISQAQLAQMAGYSKRTIIALEQDDNVGREVIESVARAFGLSEIPLRDVKLLTSPPQVPAAAIADLAEAEIALERAKVWMTSVRSRFLEIDGRALAP